MKNYMITLIAFLALTRAIADTTELPRFLPPYYSPAFVVDNKPLKLVKKTTTNGIEQVVYSTEDESLALSVENIECDKPRCDAIFNNILRHFNNTVTTHSGQFVEITRSEIHVQVVESNVTMRVFSYVLPSSVQIWTYTRLKTATDQIAPKFELIRGFADKQRYTEALSAGNVSMGHWGPRIHDYATQLIRKQRKKEGLSVLKNHLATSPFDYEAHMDLMENSDDPAAATNSARVVFKNAEDRDLTDRAAMYLGKEVANLDAIPTLSTNETGLQLILVPLPPCNPWLLDEAATIFEKITGIPVQTRRLKEDWIWSSPERIARQRSIQGMLVRLKGSDIDFTNWTKDKYIQQLTAAVESEDALSKYYVRDLIQKIEDEPGQYFVSPYLDRFCKMLTEYRSDDRRSMYVGITEANIYSGDNNYVFSQGRIKGDSLASILSYYMMLGETLGEEYQSRQRLTERIAKEVVPASLKQLGIPRSTDPTCPYSYSSGIVRLDQKTLRLSDQIKEALEKQRDPSG